MRVRTFTAVGFGVAALVLSTLVPGAATAASPDGPAATASANAGVSAPAVSGGNAVAATQLAGKCKTGFGPALPTPDGLIAWNDGGAFDTAGGADVQCPRRKRARTIKKVSAYGYFGAPTETFHVTFYRNSTAGGSAEPDDSSVICDYPSLTGTAGGQYPTDQLTDSRSTPGAGCRGAPPGSRSRMSTPAALGTGRCRTQSAARPSLTGWTGATRSALAAPRSTTTATWWTAWATRTRTSCSS